jgi:hypothetical protein
MSFHWLCRNDFAAKVCELHKLMLNSLQPLTPLSVSDLNPCSVPAVMPKLPIQLVNVSDLHPETPNLGSKNSQIIHHAQDTFLDDSAKAG